MVGFGPADDRQPTGFPTTTPSLRIATNSFCCSPCNTSRCPSSTSSSVTSLLGHVAQGFVSISRFSATRHAGSATVEHAADWSAASFKFSGPTAVEPAIYGRSTACIVRRAGPDAPEAMFESCVFTNFNITLFDDVTDADDAIGHVTGSATDDAADDATDDATDDNGAASDAIDVCRRRPNVQRSVSDVLQCKSSLFQFESTVRKCESIMHHCSSAVQQR